MSTTADDLLTVTPVPRKTSKLTHSLHAYFVRAGIPDEPIEYRVERVRDGGYVTRAVRAVQQGETAFFLTASFKDAEASDARQPPAPAAPDPSTANVSRGRCSNGPAGPGVVPRGTALNSGRATPSLRSVRMRLTLVHHFRWCDLRRSVGRQLACVHSSSTR
jgi:hypothetical protein